MRQFLILVVLTLASLHVLAQKPDDVLATATGLTFNASALSEPVRKLYLGQTLAVAGERTRFLEVLIREKVLETEAQARGLTSEALVAAEVKVAEPSAAEIKSVYDANRQALGGRTLEQARPQLAAFLRGNAEKKAAADLVGALKTKHKFAPGKDINAADLKAGDVLFTIAGKAVTVGDFNSRFDANIYDVKAEIASFVLNDLENAIFSTLVDQEAKARNVDASQLIATEITNKVREYTDEERATLETDLKNRLFLKYAVKIAFAEPSPVAHAVSADDDPVLGKATAPVTVIMFSDFQCSACSATHPVLKKVMAGYGDKVRLVVRDFPLESVHENAFRAALAANAARQQGKFAEYIEVLYRNQDDLDAASLARYAGELGLNIKQFELDLSSEKAAAEIRKDMADGIKFGARGTPTIFVNGVRVIGLSAEAFRKAIDRALAGGPSK